MYAYTTPEGHVEVAFGPAHFKEVEGEAGRLQIDRLEAFAMHAVAWALGGKIVEGKVQRLHLILPHDRHGYICLTDPEKSFELPRAMPRPQDVGLLVWRVPHSAHRRYEIVGGVEGEHYQKGEVLAHGRLQPLSCLGFRLPPRQNRQPLPSPRRRREPDFEQLAIAEAMASPTKGAGGA